MTAQIISIHNPDHISRAIGASIHTGHYSGRLRRSIQSAVATSLQRSSEPLKNPDENSVVQLYHDLHFFLSLYLDDTGKLILETEEEIRMVEVLIRRMEEVSSLFRFFGEYILQKKMLQWSHILESSEICDIFWQDIFQSGSVHKEEISGVVWVFLGEYGCRAKKTGISTYELTWDAALIWRSVWLFTFDGTKMLDAITNWLVDQSGQAIIKSDTMAGVKTELPTEMVTVTAA